MDIKEIILKKQQGKNLSLQELEKVFLGFDKAKVSKKQMAEFLMVFSKAKYSFEETKNLTQIMLSSGKTYDLSSFKHTVDKHSTGGVSDNTTLIVVPLFSLFGFTSIKMSGARLGHTGGTADKIKVFEGMKNDLSEQETFEIAKKVGACFITSSEDIAPLDKKVYALRDEIGAMSISLIASSIMSKKLATGNKNLVLDVKFGNGALLKTKKEAKILAKAMKKIGLSFGVETSFVLGDMNQPLGNNIGEQAEVFEVLEILKNPRETRLLKHSLKLVASALTKPLKKSKKQVYKQGLEFVKNGKVFEKLKQIVLAQGGVFPKDIFMDNKTNNFATENFTLKKIDTQKLGFLDKKFKEEITNFKGFQIMVELGQKVQKGYPLFTLFENNLKKEQTDYIFKELNSTLYKK